MLPERLEAGPFGSPFKFTGEMMDSNGLVYLRARYYVPGLGVFPSLDPVENLNRYQYVDANPNNRVDPSGMVGETPGAWVACPSEEDPPGSYPPCPEGWAFVDKQFCGGDWTTAFVLPLQSSVGVPPPPRQGCCQKGYTFKNIPEAWVHEEPDWWNPFSSIGWSDVAMIVVIAIPGPADDVAVIGGIKVGPKLWKGAKRVLPWLIAETGALVSAIATNYDDNNTDDCPDGSTKITWPTPIWISLSIGDTGATSGVYDGPNSSPPIPRVLVRTRTGSRNQSLVSQYVNNNSGVLGQIYPGQGCIHHKWPLFLGGPDEYQNLVYLPDAEHNAWHTELSVQGKSGWMYFDPPGTEYCVVN